MTVDVAWGGMFYVIADAAPFGLRLTPDEGRDITRIGEMIKAATQEQLPVVHPENPEITGRDDRAALGPAGVAGQPPPQRRHRLDRDSSTGTGRRRGPARSIARRAAPAPARRWRRSTRADSLTIGEPFRHEGVLGTVFTGTLLEETSVGPYRAVVPELGGHAWITGFAQYVVDPQDPFPEGFTVGDIW